jgi:hypothetical protein
MLIEIQKENLLLADQAFRNNDSRQGLVYILQILRDDFTNTAAWQLLYQAMKSSLPFDEFQIEMTKKYFPNKLQLMMDHQLDRLLEATVVSHPSVSQASQVGYQSLPPVLQSPAADRKIEYPATGTDRGVLEKNQRRLKNEIASLLEEREEIVRSNNSKIAVLTVFKFLVFIFWIIALAAQNIVGLVVSGFFSFGVAFWTIAQNRTTEKIPARVAIIDKAIISKDAEFTKITTTLGTR